MTFTKFDIAKNVIIADLGAILVGANVDHTAQYFTRLHEFSQRPRLPGGYERVRASL